MKTQRRNRSSSILPVDIPQPIRDFLLMVNSNRGRITYVYEIFSRMEVENRHFRPLYFDCRILLCHAAVLGVTLHFCRPNVRTPKSRVYHYTRTHGYGYRYRGTGTCRVRVTYYGSGRVAHTHAHSCPIMHRFLNIEYRIIVLQVYIIIIIMV